MRNGGSQFFLTQSRHGAAAESVKHSLKQVFMLQARLVALQAAHMGERPIVRSKHGLEQLATSGSLKQDSAQLSVLLEKSLASITALSRSPVQPNAIAGLPPLPADARAPAAADVPALAGVTAIEPALPAVSVLALALEASDHLLSVQ